VIWSYFLNRCVLITTFYVIAAVVGRGATAPPMGTGAKYTGPGACSSVSCHGSVQPRSENSILQNEYATWTLLDKHAKANAVLTNDVSKGIGRILGLRPETSAKCLDCHSLSPQSEQQARSFDSHDGISCESCHGPASNWLGPHTTKGWTHSRSRMVKILAPMWRLADHYAVWAGGYHGLSAMRDRFDFLRLLAFVTGLVNQELLLRNEYLTAENRILRARLSSRFRLSDAERSTLAEIAKRLGRKALKDIAQVAKPDTILGWYRQLVARKFDGSRQRGYPGRPPVSPEVEELVVRFARENRSWGYDRIVGALANLGHQVSDQTVGNILHRHDIAPLTIAVLPSADRADVPPWYIGPPTSVPMSGPPCWLQTPLFLVKTQLKPLPPPG
jgi:Homeodomain-like domain/Cytochrome c554 and c-prime